MSSKKGRRENGQAPKGGAAGSSSQLPGPGAAPQDPAAAAFLAQMQSGGGPPAWQDRFAVDRNGNPTGTLQNLMLVLENDPRWAGVISLDEFGRRVMKQKPPPFPVP